MAILLLWLVGGFLAIGLVFAGAFVTVGMSRIDSAAHGAPWTVRLLVVPGAAALWPLLLVKWVSASCGRD